MSEVKRFDHVNHAHVDDCEHIENPEGAWVKASDYDALAAKLAMAEDAAAKGAAARQQCGGMEMEIEELRAEAQALREEVAQQKFLTKVENDALKMMTDKANELKSEVEQLEEELESLRARVVVVPERRVLPNYSDYPLLYCEITGFNDCLDELARLNGKTVSEALLRRLARPADRYDEVFTLDRHEAAEELRALLSDQEGGRQ